MILLFSIYGALCEVFQSSPDKVHAQQSLSGADGLSSPDCLIPNTDPLIVGSHFSPPHPGGFAEDDSMGLLHLWDLDVRALKVKIDSERQTESEKMLVNIKVTLHG